MEKQNTSAVNATATLTELDDLFWDDLLTRIHENEVVPIVGRGLVTFGPDDELLYPWLARRLPGELKPPLTFENPPRDLQQVVDAQRATNQRIERVYRLLNLIVKEPDLRPGPTLARLAAIEGFQLFISATFDPLLPRAVESASPGGKPDERQRASTLRGACPDLPQELDLLEHRFVYQLLGSAQPYPDFVISDEDMFRFLLHLDQQLPQLPKLSEALQKSHFLALGLSFADWLMHFFIQVVKHAPLSELDRTDLFIFEKLDSAERAQEVIYFSRLTKQIQIVAIDPLEFVAELHDRWFKEHPAPVREPYAMNKEQREKHRAPGCIFVSYATPDLEIARFVVSQLQKAGCLVWFDKEQLQPGEDWEEALRKAVEERCGLFISIISDHTAERLQGYNIFERKLAAKRRERLADNAIFYLPVRIDQGQPLIPENEPRGTGKIQAVVKEGGYLDEEFIGYLREKQRENCAALGYPLPPT
jgi:hypothetical protein